MSTPNYGRPSREVANWLTSRSAGFYRTLSYLAIIFSVYLFASAAHDEQRGIASVIPPGRYARRIVVIRSEHPTDFHNLMIYQWSRAALVLCGGLIILGICRRADRCDPFSPDFSGGRALDDCERTLDNEIRKKHSPLR